MSTARTLSLAPFLAAFLLIPWSRDLSQLADSFDLGLLLILALLALPPLTLLLDTTNPAEPATASALRAALQKLLAQLPLAFTVLTAALATGSFNLFTIAFGQAGAIHRWLAFHDPFNLVAFALSILILHGTLQSRPALEAPYRETHPQEKRRYIPFAKAPLLLLCALQTALWLGAWYDPFGIVWHLERISHDTGVGPAIIRPGIAIAANLLGLLVFLSKSLLLVALQNALARNLPRYRLTELFPLLHKMILPGSLLNFLAAAAFLWLWEPLLKLQNVTQIVLAVVGVLIPTILTFAVVYSRLSAKRTS
jgi:NADH:ubiquinone oxidoreductase subunit H